MKYRNKKTGRVYHMIDRARNCTNAQDGEEMVLYAQPSIFLWIVEFFISLAGVQLYVRNNWEFFEKFEEVKNG